MTISRDSPYHNIDHQVIRRGYKTLGLPLGWWGICSMDSPREDVQNHDIFISLTATHYVIVNSRKDRVKPLRSTSWKTSYHVDFMQELKRSKDSIDKPLRWSKNSINKPSQGLTIRFRSSSMKKWHCKHKEMYIRPSYKDVKIKSLTLLSIIKFLVHMIQVKITLLWLLRKTPPPKKMSFMSIPTILQEYKDGLLAQKDDRLVHNIRIIDS